MLTSWKTDFRQEKKTSPGLKITFVDMTYPGQCPEIPSLSPHFLLVCSIRCGNHLNVLLHTPQYTVFLGM